MTDPKAPPPDSTAAEAGADATSSPPARRLSIRERAAMAREQALQEARNRAESARPSPAPTPDPVPTPRAAPSAPSPAQRHAHSTLPRLIQQLHEQLHLDPSLASHADALLGAGTRVSAAAYRGASSREWLQISRDLGAYVESMAAQIQAQLKDLRQAMISPQQIQRELNSRLQPSEEAERIRAQQVAAIRPALSHWKDRIRRMEAEPLFSKVWPEVRARLEVQSRYADGVLSLQVPDGLLDDVLAHLARAADAVDVGIQEHLRQELDGLVAPLRGLAYRRPDAPPPPLTSLRTTRRPASFLEREQDCAPSQKTVPLQSDFFIKKLREEVNRRKWVLMLLGALFLVLAVPCAMALGVDLLALTRGQGGVQVSAASTALVIIGALGSAGSMALTLLVIPWRRVARTAAAEHHEALEQPVKAYKRQVEIAIVSHIRAFWREWGSALRAQIDELQPRLEEALQRWWDAEIAPALASEQRRASDWAASRQAELASQNEQLQRLQGTLNALQGAAGSLRSVTRTLDSEIAHEIGVHPQSRASDAPPAGDSPPEPPAGSFAIHIIRKGEKC